jgi:glutathione S-transferase
MEDLGKVEPSADGDRKFLLVGMLDSPFVRRVAIALEHYGYVYENLSVATMAQEAEFARFSPLKRAPTLILPGGAPLFDSHLILQHLDDFAPAERALLPPEMAARLRCRQVMGIAAGLADKAVSATYEKVFHQPEAQNQRLLARIRGQLLDALLWLEQVSPECDFLFGEQLSHADIVVGTGLCFAREQHPDLLSLDQAPKVRAWCARLDALPSFQQTYLAVVPPTG